MTPTQSPSRLMLYALLSAIETDLRAYIAMHALATVAREFLGTDLYDGAIDRVEQEESLISAEPPLEEFLPFVDFADHL